MRVRPFQSGDRVASYVLETELGHGGFGVVWRARNAKTGQTVALKMLTGGYSATDSPRIQSEVELLAAAAIDSPHVVRVLDGGVEPVPFIAMEYVEGTDLASVLSERGVLTQQEALHVARGVAEALGDLQRAGVIHRDIKPANVMLTRDGIVKLTDLGIAKIVGFNAVTLAGQSPMSMAYAAPEAWEAETSYLSDVYAYGVMLFQCLAGRPPFTGTPVEMMSQHRAAEPNIDALPANTAPSLRELISACLRKAPGDRPQGAAAMLSLVEGAERELVERGDAEPADASRSPAKLGPWIIQSTHTAQRLAFICAHEQTGDHATVEVLGADTLALGEQLERAVQANGALVPLGAERLLGESRLILRPGERFRDEPAGAFLFWVARDERPRGTPPSSITREALLVVVDRVLGMIDTARAAGLPLVATPSDFAADTSGAVTLRRPGLPPTSSRVLKKASGRDRLLIVNTVG